MLLCSVCVLLCIVLSQKCLVNSYVMYCAVVAFSAQLHFVVHSYRLNVLIHYVAS